MNAADASVTDRIATGMPVVDARGEEIGTVALVRPADPNAVTVEGAVDPQDAIGDAVPHPQVGDEPATAPDVAARLLRTGFIKISTTDRAADRATDRAATDQAGAGRAAALPGGVGYASVEQLAAVDAGVVRLAVPRSEVTPPA